MGAPTIQRNIPPDLDGRRVVVKASYYEHSLGRVGTVIGPAVSIDGVTWTPLIWDGKDEPDWFKTRALELP